MTPDDLHMTEIVQLDYMSTHTNYNLNWSFTYQIVVFNSQFDLKDRRHSNDVSFVN